MARSKNRKEKTTSSSSEKRKIIEDLKSKPKERPKPRPSQNGSIARANSVPLNSFEFGVTPKKKKKSQKSRRYEGSQLFPRENGESGAEEVHEEIQVDLQTQTKNAADETIDDNGNFPFESMEAAQVQTRNAVEEPNDENENFPFESMEAPQEQLNDNDSEDIAVQREMSGLLLEDECVMGPAEEAVDPNLRDRIYSSDGSPVPLSERQKGKSRAIPEEQEEEMTDDEDDEESQVTDEEMKVGNWGRVDKSKWYEYFMKVNNNIHNTNFDIEEVLRWRYHPRKEKFVQYRIKWRGYRDWTNSWEPSCHFNRPEMINSFWKRERDNGRERPKEAYKNYEKKLKEDEFAVESDDTYSEVRSKDKKKKKDACQRHVEDVRKDRFVVDSTRKGKLKEKGVPLFNSAKGRKNGKAAQLRLEVEKEREDEDEDVDMQSTDLDRPSTSMAKEIAVMICGQSSSRNNHAGTQVESSPPRRLRSGAIRIPSPDKSKRSRKKKNSLVNGNSTQPQSPGPSRNNQRTVADKEEQLEYSRSFLTSVPNRGRRTNKENVNRQENQQNSITTFNPHREPRPMNAITALHPYLGAHKGQGKIMILSNGEPSGTRTINGHSFEDMQDAETVAEQERLQNMDSIMQDASQLRFADDSGSFVDGELDAAMKEGNNGDEMNNSVERDPEIRTPPLPDSEGEVEDNLNHNDNNTEKEVWGTNDSAMLRGEESQGSKEGK